MILKGDNGRVFTTNKIENVERIQKALNKANAVSVITSVVRHSAFVPVRHLCPRCHTEVHKSKYCPGCGQRLKY